jgi:hypothetical protein
MDTRAQFSETVEFGGLKWFISPEMHYTRQDIDVYLYLGEVTEAQLPVKVQYEIRIGHGDTALYGEKQTVEFSKANGSGPWHGHATTFDYGKAMAAKDDNDMIYIECILYIYIYPSTSTTQSYISRPR